MHPADIKAALQKKGVTQRALIQGICKDRSVVSHIIHGRTRARAVERRIAELTGIPLHRLWPRWYPAKPRREAAWPRPRESD